jgi:excisionase family DNA binding protein
MLIKSEFQASAKALDPAVLRIKESAAYLSVSKGHLYKLIAQGDLSTIKLGTRASGIRRAELDRWIEKGGRR